MPSEDVIAGVTFKVIAPSPKITVGDGKLALTWEAVPNAEKYAIYKYENGKYVTVSKSYTKTNAIIKGLTNGQKYYFLVMAYVDGKWSDVDKNLLVSGTPVAPVLINPAPKVTIGDGKLALTWEAIPNASQYAIYKYENGKYVTISKNYTKTNAIIKGLTNGQKYYFLVMAYVDGKWSDIDKNLLVSGTPVAPVSINPKPAVTIGDGKLALTWEAIPNASKYAIYKYENGKYVTITKNYAKTSAIIKNLTNGQKYYFLVMAYVDGKWSKVDKNLLVSGTPVGATASINPAPKVTIGDGKLALTWNAIPNAEKYAIYQYVDGKYVTITKNYAKTNAIIKNLTNGQEYKFLVMAYVDGKWSKVDKNLLVSGTPLAGR